MASWLDEDLEDVIEVLSARGCFTPTSLDRPIGDDGGATLGDLVAGAPQQVWDRLEGAGAGAGGGVQD